MATNSHYFQRALLQKIFGSQKVYEHIYPSNKLALKNVKNIGSKEHLFEGDESFIKELESKMNASIESEMFSKVINSKKGDEIIMTYNESVLLRKYLLITYLRANLGRKDNKELKKRLTKIIDLITTGKNQLDTNISNDPAVNFFLKNSFIRFVKHKNISLAWPQNYFLAIPIDFRESNIRKIFSITNRYPGFLFRIDKENSVIITNTRLYFELMTAVGDKLQNRVPLLRAKINAIDPNLWLVNINSIIYPDGSEENQFGNKEGLESERKFIKKINKIDKTNWKYKYPIAKMKDFDYELLILDNMMKFIATQSQLGNVIETYFSSHGQVKNLFKKWMRIEKGVENNEPANIEYWSKTQGHIFKHKVWEIILDKQVDYMSGVIETIKKIKKL